MFVSLLKKDLQSKTFVSLLKKALCNATKATGVWGWWLRLHCLNCLSHPQASCDALSHEINCNAAWWWRLRITSKWKTYAGRKCPTNFFYQNICNTRSHWRCTFSLLTNQARPQHWSRDPTLRTCCFCWLHPKHFFSNLLSNLKASVFPMLSCQRCTFNSETDCTFARFNASLKLFSGDVL